MSLSLDPSLTLAALERIDLICQAFEQAWQNVQAPQIEAYLGDVHEPERSSLLYQLLLLELDYRSHRGDTPSLAHYRIRFSGHSALIDTAFDKQSALSTDSAKVPELEKPHVHEKNAVADNGALPHPGLPIRCHCHKKTEIVVDTPLAEITCSSCGCPFSLVPENRIVSLGAPKSPNLGMATSIRYRPAFQKFQSDLPCRRRPAERLFDRGKTSLA